MHRILQTLGRVNHVPTCLIGTCKVKARISSSILDQLRSGSCCSGLGSGETSGVDATVGRVQAEVKWGSKMNILN